MIDVQDVLRDVPPFETFCSVEKLHGLIERLRTDARFTVEVAGTSTNGVPIYQVRFGAGSVKALIVAGPHAMEPIGSLTVFSLLSLLQQGHRALCKADVEWHIVPCIDPDGTLLNEGWTQQPFTLERYVRHFYLQPRCEQVDFSFPIAHRKLVFDRPSREAKILQGILDRARPDFYFSLHNAAAMGGTWYFLSRDIGRSSYDQIYDLMAQHQVRLQARRVPGVEQFADGMRELPTFKNHYDYLERQGVAIPAEYLQGKLGAASQEYLLQIKPDALVFGAELTYGQHPCEVSEAQTGQPLRQLQLRVFADNKFLAAAILEEWERVKADLEVTSPFYRKILNDLVGAKDTLHEGLTEWYEPSIQSLLFNPAAGGIATERERIQAHMAQTYFLGNAYCFVRLLKASNQTPAVKQAIERLEPLFTAAIDELKATVDFSAFEVTACGALAQVQLGSGLIALNALLETRSRSAD